ncbi:IclR family transcriptional regulator [Lysinibacter cavernae]|uniref:DNA-binding IclR family transcriptional regulator n=1 Tax=Lysinibacter cavernae TaxID=1640652 RepID=A0A7X5TU80_9MICO|nr:IclR family transcriptional regulator [Lysinibacter cavernae]NIH54294.1 DNA-binding IclR family transcriptional regulator [Lysinibacter cavernae]
MAQPIQGAQVVSRVSDILRTVSERAPHGISTADVVAQTTLTRPTAHRLLTSLAAEGFIDHDARKSLWYLGPELYLIGSLAAERYDISALAQESLRTLARETGESAFLSARRGDETVCLFREEGSFPIRSFVLTEGIRFPLGVASAGLVLLAHLPSDEAEDYLGRAHLSGRWGAQHSAVPLRERIAETRQTGYAVNPGLLVEGSWGMGAVVFDRADRPAWALSLTGIESRFRPERQPELGRLLLEQAHLITKKIRNEG